MWRDLWLNLLAEAFGAAFIVLFVDVLFERSKDRDRDERRRAAIADLGLVLRELRNWLARLYLESESPAHHETADDPARLPAEAFLDDLPRYLGAIDFAAPGRYRRDRYLIEWARRSFDGTALELARWERNFAGSDGIFDDEFRRGAEQLRDFVRAIGSFLEGMERYIVRDRPSPPVFAYEGVTELTEDEAAGRVSELREFLRFYGEQCERYGTNVPTTT